MATKHETLKNQAFLTGEALVQGPLSRTKYHDICGHLESRKMPGQGAANASKEERVAVTWRSSWSGAAGLGHADAIPGWLACGSGPRDSLSLLRGPI
jgi:hypothetical protein